MLRGSFLFLLIAAIMITLSQILVVHRRVHGSVTSSEQKNARTIIETLEKLIASMMKTNYVPLEQSNEMLLAYIYSERIKRSIMRLRKGEDRHHGALRQTFGRTNQTLGIERISRQLQFVMPNDMNMDVPVIQSPLETHISSFHNSGVYVKPKSPPTDGHLSIGDADSVLSSRSNIPSCSSMPDLRGKCFVENTFFSN